MPMPLLHTSMLETSDNRQLRIIKYTRKSGYQKGTVIFLQGVADNIARYKELFSKLGERGFSYASLDWYGQGGSLPPNKGKHENFRHRFDINRHIGDLDEFLHRIVYTDCPPPYYFLCYETGCLIAISAIDVINNQCDRLIGISPLFSPLGYRIGGIHYKINKTLSDFGLGRMKLKQSACLVRKSCSPLTAGSDHNEQKQLPLLDRHWLADIFETAAYAKQRLQKNDQRFPALFVTSHNDSLASASEVRRFCHDVRLADTITLSGASHDLFHASDWHKKQFWALFDAFIPGTNAYDINR